jgi:PAS domain S-box-containing protein
MELEPIGCIFVYGWMSYDKADSLSFVAQSGFFDRRIGGLKQSGPHSGRKAYGARLLSVDSLADGAAMNRIGRSIPVKVSLILLAIEVVVLTLLGAFYSSRFSHEIDSRIAEKMALPAMLMNQRAMTFDSVKDFHSLSDLVQEKVVEAFIFRRDGRVFIAADPAKEGKPFTDFLAVPEKSAYGGEMPGTRQLAFTGAEGGHFLSSMTPLLAHGEVPGGLYIRISAEAVQEKKAQVVWFFCLGAILTILLTTLVEAVVVHRLFVPRIDHAATVLHRYAEGDFSSRITHTGAADQLGELMQRVNYLLETIQEYTGKLHALNIAGEALARTDERDGVFRIAVATAEQELAVRIITTEDSEPLFTLPVGGDVGGGTRLGFTRMGEQNKLSRAEIGFVHALSGLMESTLRRIVAFTRLAKAEEKYRYLFESALEGIFRTNRDGVILDANLALAVMAGFNSVDELFAAVQNVSEWYEDPRGREKMLELLKNEEKIHDYEVNLKRRDGSVYPVSLSARLIRDRHGEVRNVEGRIIDITERR